MVKSKIVINKLKRVSVRAQSKTSRKMKVKYLYVYILKCSDGTYYTGVTNNPEKRVIQHNKGLDPEAYTYSRRPVTLAYCELFTNYNLGIDWETRIKK